MDIPEQCMPRASVHFGKMALAAMCRRKKGMGIAFPFGGKIKMFWNQTVNVLNATELFT